MTTLLARNSCSCFSLLSLFPCSGGQEDRTIQWNLAGLTATDRLRGACGPCRRTRAEWKQRSTRTRSGHELRVEARIAAGGYDDDPPAG